MQRNTYYQKQQQLFKLYEQRDQVHAQQQALVDQSQSQVAFLYTSPISNFPIYKYVKSIIHKMKKVKLSYFFCNSLVILVSLLEIKLLYSGTLRPSCISNHT